MAGLGCAVEWWSGIDGELPTHGIAHMLLAWLVPLAVAGVKRRGVAIPVPPGAGLSAAPVSYTHLTLPTILLV